MSNGCRTTKQLKKHWYPWFLDQKPLENTLLPMFFESKTIGKPLLPMVLETKNHRTTIDINAWWFSNHLFNGNGEYENF